MIRKYTKSDIERIIDLETKTLGTTLGYEMLLSELDNSMANYFVYDDGNVQGYVSTTFDGSVIEILNICVEPAMQNKSIGKKLMAHVLEYYYPKNAESVFLEVRCTNVSAIGFYKGLGFKQAHVRKSYYSNGDDALVMIKSLVE